VISNNFPIAQAHALLMLILGKHKMGIFTLPPADVERIEQEISGIKPIVPKPWSIKVCRMLSWGESLRAMAGIPVVARFDSPDGECHAACNVAITVGDAQASSLPSVIDAMKCSAQPPHNELCYVSQRPEQMEQCPRCLRVFCYHCIQQHGCKS
jgi:hypothetical protein